MPGGVSVAIITNKDKDGFIISYEWEILTAGAIIKSRNGIETKNNTFISLKRHLASFLNMQVTPGNVKNREVIHKEITS